MVSIMKILAADTTTSICSVAVCGEDRILAETFVDCGRTHTERLIMTIDWALAEAALTLQDIDALAVTVGPGSFTGLRVGVAAFKGLALGRNLPLISVPTLDAMARQGALFDGCLCPLIDAKMHEVFGAVYRYQAGVRTKLTDDIVAPVERLLELAGAPTLVLGDGAAVYAQRIRACSPQTTFAPRECSLLRASTVAAEAAALLERGISTDPAAVSPVYLRKSQPEEKRDKAASP